MPAPIHNGHYDTNCGVSSYEHGNVVNAKEWAGADPILHNLQLWTGALGPANPYPLLNATLPLSHNATLFLT